MRDLVRENEERQAVKRGEVLALDAETAKARVRFPDEDGLTLWLPVIQRAAHQDRAFWLPCVGSQVWCALDWRGEDGAVLGAIYSTRDAPPGASADDIVVALSDGAAMVYDRGEATLTVKAPTRIVLEAGGARLIIADGIVTIEGGLTITGAMSGAGELHLQDDLRVDGQTTLLATTINGVNQVND